MEGYTCTCLQLHCVICVYLLLPIASDHDMSTSMILLYQCTLYHYTISVITLHSSIAIV